MKNIFTAIIFLLVFTSCEKEIDMDYKSIEALHVIEGYVTNEKTKVLVSMTRDMEDGSKDVGIDYAIVKLTDSEEYSELLQHDGNGLYLSPSSHIGTLGKTYQLSVTIDNVEYHSSSIMNREAEIDSVFFQWEKFRDDKMLFCRIFFDDIQDETNYYCYRIYRNGEIYKWNTFNDKGRDGETVKINATCMSEKEARDNKEEDWEDILYENDLIEIELQTIDKVTYDYLYSLRLSDRTSSNPIDNFTGGCLGYFSAYSTSRKSLIFHNSDIIE